MAAWNSTSTKARLCSRRPQQAENLILSRNLRRVPMTVANNPAAQLDWLDDPSQEPKLSMLSYAKACVARGWKIFPLQPRQKNPATPHGFKDATNDLEQINRWWTENTNYNIGVACGESNLTVLDFDSDTGY